MTHAFPSESQTILSQFDDKLSHALSVIMIKKIDVSLLLYI